MSFYTTVAGRFVNEKRLDIIANNIANATTAGYKAVKPVFGMATAPASNEAASGTNQMKNAYVGLYDTFIDFSDAAVVDSGATFDMAIIGKGFFVIQGENGAMYTRDGQFTINSSGGLVTMNGDPVLGKNGEIKLSVKDGKDIRIEQDGTIYLGKDSIDTIKVVDFENKRALQPVGKNLYVLADQNEPETTPDWYSVRQGSYESSNVNVFQEMVQMIHAMRAYECYTKVEQMFSDINGKLVDLGKF